MPAKTRTVADVDKELRAASDRLADAERRLDYDTAAACTDLVDDLLDERADLDRQAS